MGYICLDCGSLDVMERGFCELHCKTTKEGVKRQELDMIELEETMCYDCNSGKTYWFARGDLSPQEKTLFFHFNKKRRLLFFLRLGKERKWLKGYFTDRDLKERIFNLEEALGVEHG